MQQSRALQIAFYLVAAGLLALIVRNLTVRPDGARRADGSVSTPALPVLYPSPLSEAAGSGNIKAVQELLKQGADINDRDHTTATALELAAVGGHVEMTRFLLAHGADPNNYRYNPVLYSAVISMPALVPELLFRGVEVNDGGDGPRNHNPLCAAIRTHNRKIVELLLEHGASVNPPPAWERRTPRAPDPMMPPWAPRVGLLPATPLGVALCDAPEFESLLLKKGAALGPDSDTIVACAAQAGRFALIPHLLERGALIDAVDPNGESALTYAVLKSPKSVPFLLAHGANPNISPRFGETALIKASAAGSADIVRQLLAHNADIRLVSASGRSALSYARKNGSAGVIALLRNAGCRE